jgi:hypothetical protein
VGEVGRAYYDNWVAYFKTPPRYLHCAEYDMEYLLGYGLDASVNDGSDYENPD